MSTVYNCTSFITSTLNIEVIKVILNHHHGRDVMSSPWMIKSRILHIGDKSVYEYVWTTKAGRANRVAIVISSHNVVCKSYLDWMTEWKCP